MRARRKLFGSKDAFDPDSDAAFVSAMRENCAYHAERCEEYRRILASEDFEPGQIVGVADLERLPFIPTAVFKKYRLQSAKHALIRATSSGTSGENVSEIPFRFGDLWQGLRMVLRVARLRKLISLRPCHYFVFGYKPHRSNRTAVTKTAFGATLFAPALSRVYALRYENGKYNADLDAMLDALLKRERSRFPVRFMGFPSYVWFLMKKMDERGISVTLPARSKILLGGGWKQFYTEQVDKSEFYALCEKTLGVKDRDVVEFFGAVEHPILYCDCERHHFHIPVYSRALVRGVDKLEPLGFGEIGLLELMTPASFGAPILAVMTDDLAIIRDGAECGCGIKTPFIEIVGRVGLRDIKTCAAGAASFLSEVEF